MVPKDGGVRFFVSGARVWGSEGLCQWGQGVREGGSVSL